jgi:hypothetical protein
MYDAVYRQQGIDQCCESGFIKSGSGYESGSSISNESGSASGFSYRYGFRVLMTNNKIKNTAKNAIYSKENIQHF